MSGARPLTLPRKGKETWWLILHQRGPIANTPAYKPTICLGCHATTSTSDHIYLECPHFRKVWLCLLDVLDTLLSLPTPINQDSICQSPLLEFALGFPSLLAGASEAQVIHTRVWVAICFDVSGMAICLLPCCLHHPSTLASLLQARLQMSCVKNIYWFILTLHDGPLALPPGRFTAIWEHNNGLINIEANRVFLRPGLLPVSLEATERDDTDRAEEHRKCQLWMGNQARWAPCVSLLSRPKTGPKLTGSSAANAANAKSEFMIQRRSSACPASQLATMGSWNRWLSTRSPKPALHARIVEAGGEQLTRSGPRRQAQPANAAIV